MSTKNRVLRVTTLLVIAAGLIRPGLSGADETTSEISGEEVAPETEEYYGEPLPQAEEGDDSSQQPGKPIPVEAPLNPEHLKPAAPLGPFTGDSGTPLLATQVAEPQSPEPELGTITQEQAVEEEEKELQPISLHYYGLFYGPSVKDPTSYQPSPTGGPNLNRPLTLRNFATLGWNVSEAVSVSATAYWHLRMVNGYKIIPQDPFLRVSHNSLINSESVNLYGDIRFHLPTTQISRANQMKLGIQVFQALSWYVPNTQVNLGLFGSARYNFMGPQGYGNDAEYYIAPNFGYQLSDKVAFTMLYEIGASHTYGAAPFALDNDGTDLEPGLNWQVTPKLMLNPFLTIYTGHQFSLRSTAFGMSASWELL